MNRPTWRKSTHSGTQEGACVEIAALPDGIGVRDSKAPDLGHLTLPAHIFTDLIDRAKRDGLTR